MNFIVIVIIKIYQPLCFLTCEQRLLSCLVGLWDTAKRSRESAKRWKGMGMGRLPTSLHFSSNPVRSLCAFLMAEVTLSWRQWQGIVFREFKQRHFWAMNANRKWTFRILGKWFHSNFRAIVSIRVKTPSNTNLVGSRHKRERPYFRLTCDARKWLCLSTLVEKTVDLCGISDSSRRSTGYCFLRLQYTLTVANFVAFLIAITSERDPSCTGNCVDLHARASHRLVVNGFIIYFEITLKHSNVLTYHEWMFSGPV